MVLEVSGNYKRAKLQGNLVRKWHKDGGGSGVSLNSCIPCVHIAFSKCQGVIQGDLLHNNNLNFGFKNTKKNVY